MKATVITGSEARIWASLGGWRGLLFGLPHQRRPALGLLVALSSHVLTLRSLPVPVS